MTNHNLLSNINGTTRILMYRYGENGIKEEDILKYIKATLRHLLPDSDAEAVLTGSGNTKTKYMFIKDSEDKNGTYKIIKRIPPGYLFSGEDITIASFWVDSNDKDITPREFLVNVKKPE